MGNRGNNLAVRPLLEPRSGGADERIFPVSIPNAVLLVVPIQLFPGR